jgi:hypothetical protein
MQSVFGLRETERTKTVEKHTQIRSVAAIAAVLLLALTSGRASAAIIMDELVTEHGFLNGGSLEILFSGDTGANDMLESPPPFVELTAFTATYQDSSLGMLTWSLLDVGGFLFDNTAGDLLALSALQSPTAFPAYRLSYGSSVSNPDNLVEIADLFGNIVSSAPLPAAGVPLPPTALLLTLGLVLLRRGGWQGGH